MSVSQGPSKFQGPREDDPQMFEVGYARRVQRSRQPKLVEEETLWTIQVGERHYAAWNPKYPHIGFTKGGDLACFCRPQ